MEKMRFDPSYRCGGCRAILSVDAFKIKLGQGRDNGGVSRFGISLFSVLFCFPFHTSNTRVLGPLKKQSFTNQRLVFTSVSLLQSVASRLPVHRLKKALFSHTGACVSCGIRPQHSNITLSCLHEIRQNCTCGQVYTYSDISEK